MLVGAARVFAWLAFVSFGAHNDGYSSLGDNLGACRRRHLIVITKFGLSPSWGVARASPSHISVFEHI